ncbi:MAG: hypothetical protein IKA72_02165 [Clostridia bacterium]|nr:hypothetical protein [Clostridia bacterium]
MKRIINVILMITCLSVVLCSCRLLGNEKSLKKVAEEHLKLSFNDATVLEEWDNHGEFHGDGETFVKLSCGDGFEENFSSEWKLLPLEGDAYHYFYEWDGVFEHPETEEKVIPQVENGYWFFKSTGPMNWEFALFDFEENILYFYIFDA